MRSLRIFARAIWRSEAFVRAFEPQAVVEVAQRTLAALKGVTSMAAPDRREVAALTRYCELLLGLLRSRDSEDHEIRILLQPHQAVVRDLAEQTEQVITFIARSPFSLESRVQVANLPGKPEGDDTPDLLFALRLYLTGDIGANAIRVTGVREDD